MSGRNLHTDTGFAFRHYRIVETCDIDAFIKHLSRIYLREFRIIEHYCADGTLCRFDVKTGSQHLVSEIFHVLNEGIMYFIAFLEHPEHFQTCAYHGRSYRVGEQIRTAALTQQFDDFLTSRSKSAHGSAKRLAESAGIYVHTSVCAVQFAYAMSSFANHTGRVAFVYHYKGIILFCQIAYLVYGSHIAIHREYAIGNYDSEPLCLRFFQTFFQFFHIGIGISVSFCFTQTHAVYYGCMVQRVGYDGIFFSKQGFKHSSVGIETCSIKYGVFSLEIIGDGSFELFVYVLGAAYETYR